MSLCPFGLFHSLSQVARRLLKLAGRLFDRLDARWESAAARHVTGSVLVVAFIAVLLLVTLNRLELLPESLRAHVPLSHFFAVEVAFSLLLILEVIALVFSLAESISNSVGKQFEILSLILLRHAFQEFSTFGEPVEWASVKEALFPVLADAVGSLAVFVLLGLYYRMQRHRPIIADSSERESFVLEKKSIALLLLLAFCCLGLYSALHYLRAVRAYPFFEVFYTVLIFTDILLVLVSLRHTTTYGVFFRNSGFAASTVFMRLALTAPPIASAAIGSAAALFAVALTITYNAFAFAAEGHEGSGAPPNGE